MSDVNACLFVEDSRGACSRLLGGVGEGRGWGGKGRGGGGKGRGEGAVLIRTV